ncbi:reverse transcriptase domain-containing protein [Nephila pilipes]|uniref:Reverse transcriptase domain-containing protein n=1 Tax=Nephila pilipes TaxID=299642 RepID=A0A8X6N1L9_NEPPI|nr:reverse transcriptase domain-containing protein [Nephila pilipes]
MNTIQPHIQPDAKIACSADDIAVWHSHNDTAVSEEVINATLDGIVAWAEDFKLAINADKTTYFIFSTDRQHRSTFSVTIRIRESQMKKVDHPKYLDIILDPELRFSKRIENPTNRVLKKVNILRNLCGTYWSSRSHTLKSTYSTVIRPVLEYASPIWTPASTSAKQKLDSVQHRASKIIIGAISSINNVTAVHECGLLTLESRCILTTVKFTNKIRCNNTDPISTWIFNQWKDSDKFKRSSTLQFDKEIRRNIQMAHSSLDYLPEPIIPKSHWAIPGFA